MGERATVKGGAEEQGWLWAWSYKHWGAMVGSKQRRDRTWVRCHGGLGNGPHDAHALIPEPVSTSHGKRDFAAGIKSRILGWGDHP